MQTKHYLNEMHINLFHLVYQASLLIQIAAAATLSIPCCQLCYIFESKRSNDGNFVSDSPTRRQLSTRTPWKRGTNAVGTPRVHTPRVPRKPMKASCQRNGT